MGQRFIIFARENMEATRQLHMAMSEAVRAGDVCWCLTLESFWGEFRGPHDYTALILLIETRSDLEQLLRNQDLIEDLRIFLVLPDSAEETIALAHRLFPRFITYTDSNFTAELTAIIRKMATMSD